MMTKGMFKRHRRRVHKGLETPDRVHMFTRRTIAIGCGQGVLLTVLAGRLAWLQVAQGEKYTGMAEENRIDLKLIAPSRGEIVDRYGNTLAGNQQDFEAHIVPERADNLRQVLERLATIIALSETDINTILEKAKDKARFVPIKVADSLKWEDVARIEVHLPRLPGVSIQAGEVRHYPRDKAFAHLVGYVGAVNEEEMGRSRVLSLPGAKIGKTGIEAAYENKLRGQAGRAQVEVNVLGREIRELDRVKPQSGKTVTLSVDAELQERVQQRLSRARSAAAVIMDVHTGGIYALSSYPSFAPGQFTSGIAPPKWEALLSDPANPLNNKAVSGLYPPGSTFKMVTALAGLDSGVIDHKTEFHCPGHFDYGNDRFHCWKSTGHGTMSLDDAIIESCDTYFYKAAVKIGIAKIAETARKLGLGADYNLPLAETRSGLVPDKQWKRGRFGTKWQPGETIVAAIGQGYTQATPLQLAVMTSRLVNGGRRVEPWVTGYIGNRRVYDTKWPRIDLAGRHLRMIEDAMARAVNARRGTAYNARIKQEGMHMGGKTGTSQIRRITEEEREAGIIAQSELPWKLRHHALFVGYAPIEDPRYAAAVVVEHGGSGSSAAAPVARDILKAAQQRDPARVSIKAGGHQARRQTTSDSGNPPGKG